MKPLTFDDLWQQEFYRNEQVAQRLVPEIIKYIPSGSMINDYGAGLGKADLDLVLSGYAVNMVDISEKALSDEVKPFIGDRFTSTIAPLERLPDDFPVADWGICIGVLMLVNPESLQIILAEIKRTCRNLFIVVANAPYIKLGRDWTTIKGDRAFWAAQLKKHWPIVESLEDPEHIAREFLVCRGNHEAESI